MVVSLQSLLALGAALAPLTFAQSPDPQLTGTWTTKSRKVITGPVRTPPGMVTALAVQRSLNA